MDKETQDLIIQLMEKLDMQMQPNEDDLAERLPGKYKKAMPVAAVKITKVEPEMDMEEDPSMDMGAPGDEAEALKKRLLKLKGC